MKDSKAKVGLILSMLIFGTIGIFRKNILLPSGMLAMSRGFIGTAFLLAVVLLKRERINKGAVKENFCLLCLSGIMIGFNWILLFEAYRYTTVAAATLCYYMAPVFVIIAAPLIFKERMTPKKGICAVLAFLGMVCVSGIFESGFGDKRSLTGVLLGLGAAVLYAGVVIMNKKIKNISAYDKTIMQLVSAAVVLLPYTLLAEGFGDVTLNYRTIAGLLTVGIIHTGIAYALYFGAIEKLKTQTVAIFSYIDPAAAIILSAVLLRENIGVWGVVGAVLVLGAAFVSELPERSKE